MAETIKCTCSHCGAKYRLPMEAQGRTARCKRCGKKFSVPRKQSLEDTVVSWLSVPEEDDLEDAAPAKPRVINMPVAEEESEGSETVKKMHGPIRMKSEKAKEKAKG